MISIWVLLLIGILGILVCNTGNSCGRYDMSIFSMAILIGIIIGAITLHVILFLRRKERIYDREIITIHDITYERSADTSDEQDSDSIDLD